MNDFDIEENLSKNNLIINHNDNNMKKIEEPTSMNQKMEKEFNDSVNQEIKIKKEEKVILTLKEPSTSSNRISNKFITKNRSDKYKVPQSSELLFNPKIEKKKNIEPLFNKYELPERKEKNKYSNSTFQNEFNFKKAKEIFPSKFGVEMPYKNQFIESDRIKNNNFNTSGKKSDNNYKNKTTSRKKTNKIINGNSDTRIQIEIENNKTQTNSKRSNQKVYHKYKSNIKSNNPFVGLSHYDKNIKERKDLISKTVQKEENDFNEIKILEENIVKKINLTEEELNKFIITLSKYMFEKEENNLYSKESYEFKINKVSNIIKNMKEEKQKKVLENLKKNTKDEYTNELYIKLKNKIEEFKVKISKVYKNEHNLEEEL